MFTVIFSRQAGKNLEKIPVEYHGKIRTSIAALAFNPFGGKKLKGEYRGDYSLRIWPYRTFYSIDQRKKSIFITTIRHRQGAY